MIFCIFTSTAQERIGDNANFRMQILRNSQGKVGYARYNWSQDISDAKILIPYQFDWAETFSEDGFAQVELNGKYGIIDTLGKTVIPTNYDFINNLHDGFFIATNKGKYGILEKGGKQKIPFDYDYITGFDEFGNAAAVLNGQWGAVNSKNEVVLPFKFLLVSIQSKGFMRGYLKGWQLYDKNGKPMLNNEFSLIDDVKGDYIAAFLQDNISVAIVNKDGNRVVQETFKGVTFHPTKDMAIVKVGAEAYRLFDLARKKYLTDKEYFNITVIDNNILEFISYNDKGDTEMSLARITENGLVFISQNYDFISDPKNGRYLACLDGKCGIIDQNLNTIVPLIYGFDGFDSDGEPTDPSDYLKDYSKEYDRIFAFKNKFWGIMDGKGNVVLPFDYKQYHRLNQYLIVCPFGDKINRVQNWRTNDAGLIDNFGKWIIPLGVYDGYDMTNQVFNGHLYIGVLKAGKWGVYDLTDKKVIMPPQFDEMEPFYRDAIKTTENGKKGILLLNPLKYISPGNFEYLDYIKETSQFIVSKADKKGLISMNGDIIVKPEFDEFIYQRDVKNFLVTKNKKAGFIDERGKITIPMIYEPLTNPSNPDSNPLFIGDACHIRYNDKHILIDKNNKTLITESDFDVKEMDKGSYPFLFLQKRNFGKTFCYTFTYYKSDEQEFQISINGNLYDEVKKGIGFNFYDGLLLAKKNGKYGYLDMNGKEAIPFQFERVNNFANGVATVKYNGEYYKINTKGQMLKHVDMELALQKSFDKK